MARLALPHIGSRREDEKRGIKSYRESSPRLASASPTRTGHASFPSRPAASKRIPETDTGRGRQPVPVTLPSARQPASSNEHHDGHNSRHFQPHAPTVQRPPNAVRTPHGISRSVAARCPPSSDTGKHLDGQGSGSCKIEHIALTSAEKPHSTVVLAQSQLATSQKHHIMGRQPCPTSSPSITTSRPSSSDGRLDDGVVKPRRVARRPRSTANTPAQLADQQSPQPTSNLLDPHWPEPGTQRRLHQRGRSELHTFSGGNKSVGQHAPSSRSPGRTSTSPSDLQGSFRRNRRPSCCTAKALEQPSSAEHELGESPSKSLTARNDGRILTSEELDAQFKEAIATMEIDCDSASASEEAWDSVLHQEDEDDSLLPEFTRWAMGEVQVVQSEVMQAPSPRPFQIGTMVDCIGRIAGRLDKIRRRVQDDETGSRAATYGVSESGSDHSDSEQQVSSTGSSHENTLCF